MANTNVTMRIDETLKAQLQELMSSHITSKTAHKLLQLSL